MPVEYVTSDILSISTNRITWTTVDNGRRPLAMLLEPQTIGSDPAALRPTWPLVLVILGLGLTVVWTGMLGYGLVQLVGMAL
jgi:hypothetical protein